MKFFMVLVFLFLFISEAKAQDNSALLIEVKEKKGYSLLTDLIRAQVDYYVEKEKFAKLITSLDLNRKPEHYYRKIRKYSKDKVILTSDPRKDKKKLSSFMAIVTVNEYGSSFMICQTDKPLKITSNIEDRLLEKGDCDFF